MSIKNLLLLVIPLMLLAPSIAGAGSLVGTAKIEAPAVILFNNTGALTTINLTVMAGTGLVTITGPGTIAPSTQQSAELAVIAATGYLGKDFHNYDFNYHILNATNVSGPSGGMAMALLAISAISHKPLRSDLFTVTGTISSNGSIGEIGGIYDKIGAAAQRGMRFFIAPAVPAQSFESQLYLLASESFSMPIVQASTLAQAASYAFSYQNASSSFNSSIYNFYTDYKVGSIGNFTIRCSNQCAAGQFANLSRFTFNFTEAEIRQVASNPGMQSSSSQMLAQLNESRMISAKGYNYLGADFAFLDYLGAFLFSNHAVTISQGYSMAAGTADYCSMLAAPQLTSSNYEYVLGGELRQQWGNLTVSGLVQVYNQSVSDSDMLDSALYSIGEANAWCHSSQEMYSIASSIGGSPSEQAPAMHDLAALRINRASADGGMYLQAAQSAFKQGNYALAILDADYAYVLAGGALSSNLTQAAMLQNASSIAADSNFGLWATQFANEADFYVQEAKLSNSTMAPYYAQQAYTTALLAQQLSNDTQIISQNLVQYVPSGQTPQQSATFKGIDTSKLVLIIAAEATIMFFICVIILILLIIIAFHIMKISNSSSESRSVAPLRQKRIKR